MSKLMSVTVECPNCHKQFTARKWMSWNYMFGDKPEDEQAICPECGHMINDQDDEPDQR